MVKQHYLRVPFLSRMGAHQQICLVWIFEIEDKTVEVLAIQSYRRCIEEDRGHQSCGRKVVMRYYGQSTHRSERIHGDTCRVRSVTQKER